MENIIIIGVVILIIGAAIYYIRKSKKKGVKCIGCPHAGTCGKESCSPKIE